MTGRHSLGPCGKTLVRLLVYSKRIQTLGVSLILFISQAISLRVLRAPHKCHFRNISQDSSQLDPITYFQHTEMILCPPGVRVGGLAFINIKYFHMSKSKCASHSVMSSSLWPHDCSPPGSSSMEFSRQEYWSGQPFPSPENLLNSGIEPGFPALQADSLLPEPPDEPNNFFSIHRNDFMSSWREENQPLLTLNIFIVVCNPQFYIQFFQIIQLIQILLNVVYYINTCF